MPRGKKGFESGPGEPFRFAARIAGAFEGSLEHPHPERAHVVLEPRDARDDLPPDRNERFPIVARGHVGTVRLEPVAKDLLRAVDGRRHVPQRVVEIEGDGANRPGADSVGGHGPGL